MKLKLIPLLALFLFVSVCKAAKADLVFLVDGSWSIGDDNFLKIIRFLYSTSGALDRIGPDGTQVPQAHSKLQSKSFIDYIYTHIIFRFFWPETIFLASCFHG